LLFTQLGYESEDHLNRRPQIKDLQKTDPFEQCADVFVFIHRDEVYNKSGDKPEKGTAEIIIAKHKDGPIGTLKLGFTGGFLRFNNLADN